MPSKSKASSKKIKTSRKQSLIKPNHANSEQLKTSARSSSQMATKKLSQSQGNLPKTQPIKVAEPYSLHHQLLAAIKTTPSQLAQEFTKEVAELESPQKIWFLPMRIAFVLNAIYYLAFAAITLLGSFQGFGQISPFFTLPFDPSIGNLLLLEISGVFAGIVALTMLHAVSEPLRYKWLYFLFVFFILPAGIVNNLAKLQLDTTIQFQNYLFFDTVVTVILWGINFISLFAFLKTLRRKS